MKFKSSIASVALSLLLTAQASAGAIVSGFDSNTLPRNDDDSTGLVNIGFTVDFFGLDLTNFTSTTMVTLPLILICRLLHRLI